MGVAPEQAEMPRELADADLALLAKALAHPARVRILRLLLATDSCFCGELVGELPFAQATVSQHLKVLTGAGLIRCTVVGRRTCYCADRDRLEQLHDLTGGLLARAVPLSEECTCGCR